jgi:pyrroloquinoline quinone biosynthesis protein B
MSEVRAVILGTAQDGGVPHIGCTCKRCAVAATKQSFRRRVASLGIVSGDRAYLIDATPDIDWQLRRLYSAPSLKGRRPARDLSGIFISHLHFGHYWGLGYFGQEAADTARLPVFCSERAADVLKVNVPFKNMIGTNVVLVELSPDKVVEFEGFTVQPFSVKHREDLSDTYGFMIEKASGKRFLYASDFDVIDRVLLKQIVTADIAIIDGTFYSEKELLPGRMHRVQHPPITDTLELLRDEASRRTICFTHFNHTNPVVIENSVEARRVKRAGFCLAHDGMVFTL